MKNKKDNLCKSCGKNLEEHTCYWSPCVGCPDGHSSMHKTIIESPQWKKWEEYQYKNPHYDIDESRECGVMGAKHWQDFIKFSSK